MAFTNFTVTQGFPVSCIHPSIHLSSAAGIKYGSTTETPIIQNTHCSDGRSLTSKTSVQCHTQDTFSQPFCFPGCLLRTCRRSTPMVTPTSKSNCTQALRSPPKTTSDTQITLFIHHSGILFIFLYVKSHSRDLEASFYMFISLDRENFARYPVFLYFCIYTNGKQILYNSIHLQTGYPGQGNGRSGSSPGHHRAYGWGIPRTGCQFPSGDMHTHTRYHGTMGKLA